MPERQSKAEIRADSHEETHVSSLAVIGAALMLFGACLLGWYFVTSPEVIAFKSIDPAFADSLERYGFEREMVHASWALFIAPIMIITGAIFAAGGCIATAVHKR